MEKIVVYDDNKSVTNNETNAFWCKNALVKSEDKIHDYEAWSWNATYDQQ